MESNSKKSKSSFLERQRSIWSFKQVLLETVSDMIVDFSLSYRCCRAQAQWADTCRADVMRRTRTQTARGVTECGAVRADAAAFLLLLPGCLAACTTWLGQRGVVRIYQLLQSENTVSQDTAHRHRPLLWFSGSGHCSFVFCAPKHGAQTRETANADQRCGSVKATLRCAASTFVRAWNTVQWANFILLWSPPKIPCRKYL